MEVAQAAEMNVSISITGDGSALKGTVPVTVNVSPTKNLRRIELSVDVITVATSTPTSSFVYQWDTTSVNDGAHTLSARAVYPSRTSSASIGVNVANTVAPPPPSGWPASYFTGPLGASNILPASSTGALLILWAGDDGLTPAAWKARVQQRETDCGRHFDGIGIHYGGGGTFQGNASCAYINPTDALESYANSRGSIPCLSWSPDAAHP